MVHFEVTDVIRTVKYCNFSSYIMKLQHLKCILTRFFFQKSTLKKPSFHMRFTNPALSVFLVCIYNQQYQFVFNLFLSIFRPVGDSVCPGPVGGHWWWENSGGCQRSQARRKIKQFRGAIINRRNSPLGPSISTGSCSQKKPKGTKPIFQAQWSKINNSIWKFSYYRDHKVKNI